MNRDQGALDDGRLSEERDERELLEPTLGWRGMPAFRPIDPRENRLVLSFDSAGALEEYIRAQGIIVAKRTKGTVSAWWPPREREDLSSLLFTVGDPGRPTELSPGWKPTEPEPEPYVVSLRWDAPSVWAAHLGHRVALEHGVGGALVGARCVDCEEVLPDPDDGNVPDAPATRSHEPTEEGDAT